jgi:hypothetical protein
MSTMDTIALILGSLALATAVRQIFRQGMAVKAQAATLLADFRAQHVGWEIFIEATEFKPSLLAVDARSRQIAVGTTEQYVAVSWDSISRVEVENNGTALTTANRGSQLLGGVVGNVLLGPMGLLIGSMTGSKSTRQRVNELALKLVINHPTNPVHRVLFFRKGGKGEKPSARVLQAPAERLDHFHALLINAMRSVEREHATAEPAGKPEPSGVEGRIERLWTLHQAGALSEQEFAEQKQRLLAGT